MTARTQEHTLGHMGRIMYTGEQMQDVRRRLRVAEDRNADLLAACEALQTATVFLNNHALAGTDYDSTVILSALAMARAAIARARGSK
jgi:alkanesulfonate monooxygenase SsuD/methylene tetrahydromethanopterin reductase-like flavin-dependent oxidoreductase (luciferase family)